MQRMVRHEATQDDNLERYGWVRHDGEQYGRQVIVDRDYNITLAMVRACVPVEPCYFPSSPLFVPTPPPHASGPCPSSTGQALGARERPGGGLGGALERAALKRQQPRGAAQARVICDVPHGRSQAHGGCHAGAAAVTRVRAHGRPHACACVWAHTYSHAHARVAGPMDAPALRRAIRPQEWRPPAVWGQHRCVLRGATHVHNAAVMLMPRAVHSTSCSAMAVVRTSIWAIGTYRCSACHHQVLRGLCRAPPPLQPLGLGLSMRWRARAHPMAET